MARVTRSSTQIQEKDKHSELTRNKQVSKKRKRSSIGDTDDHLTKLLRAQPLANGDSTHPLPGPNAQDDCNIASLPNAGDVPIGLEIAQKILDILEMCASLPPPLLV